MPRRYDEETKAAVMAALLAGQAISEIADAYDIPEGTIKSWKSRQNGCPVAIVASEKKRRIGELLLTYLESNLETLDLHQRGIFRDQKWLRQQSASEVAVLHGVSTDKAIRLLEALGRQEEDGDALDAESGETD